MNNTSKHPGWFCYGCCVAIWLMANSELMAIENLKTTIQGNDVVLSWPSHDGEIFMVQYRSRFDSETPWIILADSYSAQSGAEQTTFVHAGIVERPSGGSGGGGGDVPPAPLSLNAEGTSSDSLVPSSVERKKTLGMDAEWPPLPWDPSTWEPTAMQVQAMTLSVTESNPVGCVGFYRVVRTGIHFYGLTNNTILSGIANLDFELGNTSTEPLMGAYVNTADGLHVNGLEFMPLDGGKISAVWDTTLVPNGIYVLQPGAQIGLDTQLLGDAVTVEVQNPISFPNVWPIAGEAMRIEAKTIHANGTWMMDIYDDQDVLLGWLEGQVDANGYCNLPGYPSPGFSLSILDDNNEQLPSNYYVVEVATFPAGSGSRTAQSSGVATATIKNYVERQWNYRTRTVVAYQQVYNPDSINGTSLRNMVASVAAAAEARYVGDPVRGNLEWPYVLNGSNEWGQLALDLKIREVRNFFYFGHSSPSSIGSSSASLHLTSQDIRKLLVNESNDPLRGLNGHPYRFVFIDGCRSAKGDLCTAFGIPQGSVALEEFVDKRGLRPRAFVGWKSTVVLALGTIDNQHIMFVQRFYDAWAHSKNPDGKPYTLRQAVDRASVSDNGGFWAGVEDLLIHGCEGLYFEE